MQGDKIMQLLLVLALIMLCGKGGNFSDIKPLIDELGDDNLKQAFDRVNDYREIFDAAYKLFPQNENAASGGGAPEQRGHEPLSESDEFFPLEPISNIADKEITYSLSKYLKVEKRGNAPKG